MTKPGRISTARWCGSGECDGVEHGEEPREYVPQRLTGSNLVDTGRVRCAPDRGLVGELLGGHVDVWREATVKCCGVTVAMPQGRAGLLLRRANRSEHGNRPGPAHSHTSIAEGQARPTVGRPVRDGAAVVGGVRESRSQGEGRQRLREETDAVMPKDAPVNTGAALEEPVGPVPLVNRVRPMPPGRIR